MAVAVAVLGAATVLVPSLHAQQYIVGGSGDPNIEIDYSVIDGGGTYAAPAPRTPSLLFPGARLKPDQPVVLRPLPPGAREHIISTTLTRRGPVHIHPHRPALRLKRSSTRTSSRTPQLRLRPPSSVTGLQFPSAPPPRIRLRKPGTKTKKSAKPRRKVTVKRAIPAKTKTPRGAKAKAKAPPRFMTRKVVKTKPPAQKTPPARKPAKKKARKALPPLKPVSPPSMKASSKPAKKIPAPRLAAPPPPPDISRPPRVARSAAPKMSEKTMKKAVPPPSGQQTAMRVPAAPGIAPDMALRIPFPGDRARLPDKATAALKALAQRLAKNNALRLQLKAYASGTKDNASRARRLSLSRALAVRSYLIRQGVRSTRIDVRALGNKAEGDPANRVDLFVVSR